MWKLILAGGALFVAGAAKFHDQVRLIGRTPTLEDYLAFRCGSEGAIPLGSAHVDAASLLMHCWGCYAMVAGAALVAAALIRRYLPAPAATVAMGRS